MHRIHHPPIDPFKYPFLITFLTLPSLSFPPLQKVRKAKVEENTTLGPQVRNDELVFGVAHIFASTNDTFVVRMQKTGLNSF